ncbi:complex I subunit 4 family protein [Actomonas aquatica]|uniref:NADH-quinone oxidoreductase subunit M n=1 Tax=Actomonas aquatica TaxID=2866162 RepID=A0ABZ1CDQ1_9BACT|nr:NADH-quinone oxidoreductase subunit M [Opitutus sp. WL0086]WRQ88764.1 NADH-quinone oxidoreductase subunit M [Opitutus sp. WL0086]
MNALPYAIYLSFAGALACLLLGSRSAAAARVTALLTALAAWACTLYAACGYIPTIGLQDLTLVPWIPELGIHYHLAADGISLTLVVLTGLAATAGILFSWNIEERAGEFFALFLALIGGVYGVFLSADAFVFFVFYEIAIVPKYFLIANWGSTNREYGAMKLVLYSFAGSALVLAGLVWTYAAGGAVNFSLPELAYAASTLSWAEQLTVFGFLFFGFATLAGIFPLHTWAPTGHVAAPTGASMLLAGVVMKLGAYGCLRVALPLLPDAFAAWQPIIAGLALIGILYAGLVALVQEDFKFVIAYSSVSHMGFVILGLAVANEHALSGAVLQMFSHGVIAGLLFAVVGRMVYERTHTRKLTALRALPLFRLMPFAAVTFVIAALASMGMPGFSGFPAELTILIGTWTTSPVWTFAAALGVMIAAAFTLRVLQLSFFGKSGTTDVSSGHPTYPPLTWPEKTGAVLLLATTILLGLRPDLLLNWIEPALQSPLMSAISKGLTS